MASIQKRGPYQWQAVIRRKGHPTQTRTFETKAKANAWVSIVESEMARNVFVDRSELEHTTLGDLLTRYGEEVSVKNKCLDSLDHVPVRSWPLFKARHVLRTLHLPDFSPIFR